MTRYVNQPQIKGGSSRIGGAIKNGINHSGMETSKPIKASRVEPSDHNTQTPNELPRSRANWGKRRLATSDTIAGSIVNATANTDSMTITGVVKKITISGATTVLSPPM